MRYPTYVCSHLPRHVCWVGDNCRGGQAQAGHEDCAVEQGVAFAHLRVESESDICFGVRQVDTHWREEEKTREGGTGAVTHQSDALRIAAKLTDVLLVKKDDRCDNDVESM